MKFNRGWIRYKQDLADCPRCGQAHPGLVFRRVRPGHAFGVHITHVAKCPVNGDPVVLVVSKPRAWTLAQTGTTGGSTTYITIDAGPTWR